jgi:hypothetical protein
MALTRHVELFLKSSGKQRSNECYSRLERVAQLGSRRAPPHYMETDAVVVRTNLHISLYTWVVSRSPVMLHHLHIKRTSTSYIF